MCVKSPKPLSLGPTSCCPPPLSLCRWPLTHNKYFFEWWNRAAVVQLLLTIPVFAPSIFCSVMFVGIYTTEHVDKQKKSSFFTMETKILKLASFCCSSKLQHYNCSFYWKTLFGIKLNLFHCCHLWFSMQLIVLYTLADKIYCCWVTRFLLLNKQDKNFIRLCSFLFCFCMTTNTV